MSRFWGSSSKKDEASDKQKGPEVRLPYFDPRADSLPSQQAQLSGDQLSKFESVLSHISSPHYVIPTTLKDLKQWRSKPRYHQRAHHHAEPRTSEDGKLKPVQTTFEALEPLTDAEKCYLTAEHIQRCLRATRWDVQKAIARSEEILVWRREYGTDKLRYTDVEEEGRTAKEFLVGFDINARPIHYMFPDRQNTSVSPRQVQFVVFLLERTIDLMPPGVENLCLCIDFNASNGGGQPTTVSQARTVLHILQTYYCERLGRAICVNVPWAFWAFYKIIGPFIDPVTKEKIRFVRDPTEARQLVDPTQLITGAFGGDLNFIYDHEKYTHELERICDERRGQLFESWKQLGGRIGTSEWDIKTHAAAPPAHPASIAASTLPALNGAKTNGIHGGAHSSKQNGAAAAGAEQPGQGQDEFHDAPLASEEDVTKAFSESLTLDGSPKATV